MKISLWRSYEEAKKQANITRFISFVNKKYGLIIESYDELYDWSIEKLPDFWTAMWQFVSIKASRQYDEVVDDLSKSPNARGFIIKFIKIIRA
jgi:acetoacetyl-CoA synthetase